MLTISVEIIQRASCDVQNKRKRGADVGREDSTGLGKSRAPSEGDKSRALYHSMRSNRTPAFSGREALGEACKQSDDILADSAPLQCLVRLPLIVSLQHSRLTSIGIIHRPPSDLQETTKRGGTACKIIALFERRSAARPQRTTSLAYLYHSTRSSRTPRFTRAPTQDS